jgi:NitT/TauT family transport system substrate-binding protein
MTFTRRLALASAVSSALLAAAPAFAQDKIRIAFGDIPSVETLHFLIGIERAKEKGVQIEFTSVKSEDIAAQAVVGGQADVGVGTPYALIQKVKAPVRMFYSFANLRFFPTVNTDFYKSWKDLDGQEIAVHSRGSGTEAIMKLAAERNGIKYSRISYVPGSEVRAGALLQGNIKATILDSTNRKVVMEKAPGKFAVLPLEGVSATDEALFATTNFLQKNQNAVDILVESLLQTAREINQNPDVVAELRKKYNLLPDLPKQLEADIVPYFRESVAAKAIPVDGGGLDAAKDDLTFFSLAGQLQGEASSLKTEDFWDFGPLTRARAKLGAN